MNYLRKPPIKDYVMRYANKIVTGGFEVVINEPFFNGKSILDIFDSIADDIRFV